MEMFRGYYSLFIVLLACHLNDIHTAILSRNKAIQSSSTYWIPSRAVDGSTRTDANACQCCSATNNDLDPWYELDLGKSYKIHQIDVIERYPWGTYGQHFQGMQIMFTQVSIVGFTDNPETTITSEVGNVIFVLPVAKITRYVSLVLRNVTQVFTICELTVYGDCYDGEYGDYCENRCHFCDGELCDKVTGICPIGKCLPGYYGEKCDTECQGGMYGPGCTQQCGNCLNNVDCNKTNGNCPGRCSAGYRGVICNQECNTNYYGQECLSQCGSCIDGATCNHVTGVCTNGCADGYRNQTCNQPCSPGNYGKNCQADCGHCRQGTVCLHKNGTCPSECAAGYQGDLCITECDDGVYGDGCQSQCGFCANDTSCNKVSGICEQGCRPGYIELYCNQSCLPGYYGNKCESQCGNCKVDTICDKIYGFCEAGCTAGYMRQLCIEECDEGKFGESCVNECGQCFNGTACDKVNGSCSSCAEGFMGTQCRVSGAETQTSDGVPSAAIGGTVGGVVLIAAAIVGVIVFLKRRNVTKHDGRDSNNFTEVQPNSETKAKTFQTKKNTANAKSVISKNNDKAATSRTENNAAEKPDEDIYYEILIGKSDLKICQLWDYINQKKIDDNVLFYQEFNLLTTGLQHPHDVAMVSENRPKNRYRAICAYDRNRVPLEAEETDESEYINASFIDGVQTPQKFIASQGPTDKMRNDFLRMIRQHNIKQVVMLTNLFEQGTKKCLIYWPENEDNDETYGNNTVKLVSKDVTTDYIIRHLQIRKNAGPWMDVTQYHFKSWPDKDVPDSTWTLVKFWRMVMEDKRDQDGPILVHCSAGVGRTGTFIALDNAFQETKSTGVLKMLELLKRLRNQRVNMVQTGDQYVFLHEAVADALDFGTHFIWSRDYLEIYDYMMQIDPDTREKRLQTQFNFIEQSIEDRKKMENENDATDEVYSNIFVHNIKSETQITIDEYMPKSKNMIQLKEFGAVLLPNYEGTNVFIVTKSPTEATLEGFWTLIADQNIKTVITMQASSSGNGKTSFNLGFTDKGIQSPFGVHLVEELNNETYCQRQLTYDSNNGPVSVSQFAYKLWDTNKTVPNDSKTMIDFLEIVLTRERRLSPTQPIIIHCGVDLKRSGLVCVLLAELERMKRDEGHINIIQTVKMMKERNETIIPNFEQYKYIYDAIHTTFFKEDVYANC